MKTTRLHLEILEDRIVPSALPDVQMIYATTTDSRTVSINYDINGASLAGQTLNFNIYRSANYNSLGGAQLIGTASIPASDVADLSEGSHQGVKLSLTAPNGQALTALTPNTAFPFIVVQANPGGSIAESNYGDNTASFETHVLGVVVSGSEFDLPLLWLNTPPAWEMQMVTALQQQDGYQAVLPFNWVRLSILPSALAPQWAADQLAQQVTQQANQLAAQHPGDVVDVNFIGHSRGTVVIGEALQDLNGSNDPALAGGYMQMTLLDPHPANNIYGRFSWLPGVEVSELGAEAALIYQALANDSQVIVPSNVMQVQVFDQQTPAGQLGFGDLSEIFVNLWGEMPSALPNLSNRPIEGRNLTDTIAPGIGLIGHTEVPAWYMANVVQTDKTFDYFG